MDADYQPRTYVAVYIADGRPQVDVSSLALGSNRQISYDADAAGDSIYTLEEAKLDAVYRLWNVWNDDEQTYETYDFLSDALAAVRQPHHEKWFCYRNEAEFGDHLGVVTQTFYWFE